MYRGCRRRGIEAFTPGAAAAALTEFDQRDSAWTTPSQIARELQVADSTLRYSLRRRWRHMHHSRWPPQVPTLRQHAEGRDWDYGEGWIEGKKGKRVPAEHITGKPWIPSKYLTEDGLDEQQIRCCSVKLFKTYYTKRRFTPPLLLVRSHMDFEHAVWTKSYLTYTQRIVGFCAPKCDLDHLRAISGWLERFKLPLKAFLAATSPRIFTQKTTALTEAISRPFPSTIRAVSGSVPTRRFWLPTSWTTTGT